jgi:hypothetical protein
MNVFSLAVQIITTHHYRFVTILGVVMVFQNSVMPQTLNSATIAYLIPLLKASNRKPYFGRVNWLFLLVKYNRTIIRYRVFGVEQRTV